MSANSIGTKIGLAFGATVTGFILDAVGFDPTAEAQPEHVLNVFFHLLFTVQLAVYVLMALLLIYVMKVEKRLPQMKAEIEARKTKQPENA